MSQEKKRRKAIPQDIAAKILFLSHRTCSVCNEYGKPVQIHHIDENPANNSPENLSVLCLHCHEETQIKGGFGRKLDAEQIRLYQANWVARVEEQRQKADAIASTRLRSAEVESVSSHGIEDVVPPPPVPLQKYISILPELLSDAYKESETLWGLRTTADMLNYMYTLAYSLENMLTYLASFYPENHFDGQSAKDFISSIVLSRYSWHRNHIEPGGHGTRGTMIGPMIAGRVVHDLRTLVEDMVSSLTSWENASDFLSWQKEWQAVGEKEKNDSLPQIVKETILYKAPSYWKKSGDEKDGPFCQRCYDAEGKLIRLQEQSSTDRWFCHACKSYFNGPRYAPPVPISIPSSGWT